MSIALVTRIVSQMAPSKTLDALHTFVVDEIAVPLRQFIKSYNAFATLVNGGYIEIGQGRLYFANSAAGAFPGGAPEGSLLVDTNVARTLFLYSRIAGGWNPIL